MQQQRQQKIIKIKYKLFSPSMENKKIKGEKSKKAIARKKGHVAIHVYNPFLGFILYHFILPTASLH